MTDKLDSVPSKNVVAGICSCTWHSEMREPGIDCPVHPRPTPSKDRFRQAERQLDLAPCRLCGSAAELWQHWLRDDVWESFGACTNLEDVDGEPCHFHLPDSPHFYRERRTDAAKYWNLIMGPRAAPETFKDGSLSLRAAQQTEVSNPTSRSKGSQLSSEPRAAQVTNPIEQEFHNIDDVVEIRRLRAEVAQARALLEPLSEHDPAIRKWLRTVDLPPAQETRANPFDSAAIVGAPGHRRISMSFETQEQYEAALVFLDMADQPALKANDMQSRHDKFMQDISYTPSGNTGENES